MKLFLNNLMASMERQVVWVVLQAEAEAVAEQEAPVEEVVWTQTETDGAMMMRYIMAQTLMTLLTFLLVVAEERRNRPRPRLHPTCRRSKTAPRTTMSHFKTKNQFND